MSKLNAAYQKLVSLDIQIRDRKPLLPLSQNGQGTWSGIGFSLNGLFYVAPINEIAEILEVPRLTQVPGVSLWVKGVANVRGRLVPVLDLMQFFYSRYSKAQIKRQRLLILESGEFYTGVVVDEVSGMQHFQADGFLPQVRIMDKLLKPFITGGYVDGEKIWPVFSPHKLFEDKKFMKLESLENCL